MQVSISGTKKGKGLWEGEFYLVDNWRSGRLNSKAVECTAPDGKKHIWKMGIRVPEIRIALH